MFYVYIIKSKKDNRLYYGFTSDLRSRFRQHNEGKVNSTKYRIPFDLIYYEAYKNQDAAVVREKLIKRSGKIRTSLKKRLKIGKTCQLLQG